jgi:hypothetical protein
MSQQTKLPMYEVYKSNDYEDWLVVYCLRDDCPTKARISFLVHARTWLRPFKRTARQTEREYKITGRSCPYCFRPSQIPARNTIRKMGRIEPKVSP